MSKIVTALVVSTLFLAATTSFFIIREHQRDKRWDLIQNWNGNLMTGPNLYQLLARSFVFVIKRPPNVATWDYGSGEYALHVIERGSNKSMCPGFSGVSVTRSDVDLAPYVGKAVLVSGFRQSDPLSGSIYIEHLELDEAVNNRLAEYKKYCPFPFERMEPFVGSN